MDDLKIVYELITDIWKLFKQYDGKKLSEEQWQQFIDSGYTLQAKYREAGRDHELLFRDLFAGIQGYYERLNI